MHRALLALSLGLALLAAAPGEPVLAAPIELMPQQQYGPGLYDTGPVAVTTGSAFLRNMVCARSSGKVISVTGQLMYSTDGGQSWLDWSPFGMSLGEATRDTKRNQLMSNADSCSGAAADARGWTDVRLFVEVAGGDATLAAMVTDAPNPDDAATSERPAPGWLPDGRQTLLDSGN